MIKPDKARFYALLSRPALTPQEVLDMGEQFGRLCHHWFRVESVDIAAQQIDKDIRNDCETNTSRSHIYGHAWCWVNNDVEQLV